MSAGARELLADLAAAGSHELARKARMRFRTSEKVLGVPPHAFKALLASWGRGPGGPPGTGVLEALFSSGVFEARLAAVELAKRARRDWDVSWAELFASWARAEDVSWRVADAVGSDLLGPMQAKGGLPPGLLESLAESACVWPWRAGLAALRPGLEAGGRDWPLFEAFARACVGEGARFSRERAAFNGFRSALVRARRGCPAKVRDFLLRHEPELPGLLEALEGDGAGDQGG
ncbi:MAG: DNA alkylation repair protein [Elusimicrobia bacterium]|nr:DNA alkylation repair protein [Elusimicrobiota bacterium]